MASLPDEGQAVLTSNHLDGGWETFRALFTVPFYPGR